jgi:hypothetical protein
MNNSILFLYTISLLLTLTKQVSNTPFPTIPDLSMSLLKEKIISKKKTINLLSLCTDLALKISETFTMYLKLVLLTIKKQALFNSLQMEESVLMDKTN